MADGGPGGGFVEVGQSGVPVEYKADSLLVYVSTDDIDATLAKDESLGGKILMPKTEIPHVGWWGVFSDPTGNRIALYTSAQHQ
jgi:predicted enzyme related to lactoylglutathione lyase